MEVIKYEQFLEMREPNKKYKLTPIENKKYTRELDNGYYLDEEGFPFKYSVQLSNFVISQKDSPIILGEINFDRWDLVYLGKDTENKYSWVRLNDLTKTTSILDMNGTAEVIYRWESSKDPESVHYREGCYKIVDKKTGLETEFCLINRDTSFKLAQYIANDKNLAKKPEEFLILDKELTFINQILNEKRKIVENVN